LISHAHHPGVVWRAAQVGNDNVLVQHTNINYQVTMDSLKEQTHVLGMLVNRALAVVVKSHSSNVEQRCRNCANATDDDGIQPLHESPARPKAWWGDTFYLRVFV